MRRLWIAIFLLGFTLWGGENAASTTGDGVVRHASTIPYTGRPIMLLFDSRTCPYCKKMKKELLSDPELHKIAVQFDLYNIPRDDQQAYTILGNATTTQSLQMLYKVKVTPYVVLLTSKGVKIWQIPGYVKPHVLAAIMEFVKGVDEGKYQKSEWREYLKKAGVI